MEEADAVEFSPSYRILEATNESDEELRIGSDRNKDIRGGYREESGFENEGIEQSIERSKKNVESGNKDTDELYQASYNMSFSSSPNQMLPRSAKFQNQGYSQQLQSPSEEGIPSVNVRLERIDDGNYEIKGKNLMPSFNDTLQSNQNKSNNNNGKLVQQHSSINSQGNQQLFKKRKENPQPQQRNAYQYEEEENNNERQLNVQPIKLINQDKKLQQNTSNEERHLQDRSMQNASKGQSQMINDNVQQIIKKRATNEKQQQQQRSVYQQQRGVDGNYEKAYHQVVDELQETQKQLAEVENSLRIETLNFEEAKRCMQILRNSLSQKIEDSTLRAVIENAAGQARMNKIDFYTYISSQSKNKERERENQLEKQMTQMKEQMEQLEQFNDSLSTDLKNAIYALQLGEEEKENALQAQKQAILEQNSHEKDQLLDYLTDYKKQIDMLQQETLSLREQIDRSHARLNKPESNQEERDDHIENQREDDNDDDEGEKHGNQHKSHESSFNDRSIVQQRIDKATAADPNSVFAQESESLYRCLNDIKGIIGSDNQSQNIQIKYNKLIEATRKLIIETEHCDNLRRALENDRKNHQKQLKDAFEQLEEVSQQLRVIKDTSYCNSNSNQVNNNNGNNNNNLNNNINNNNINSNNGNNNSNSNNDHDHNNNNHNLHEDQDEYEVLHENSQERQQKVNEDLQKMREIIEEKINEINQLNLQFERSQEEIAHMNSVMKQYQAKLQEKQENEEELLNQLNQLKEQNMKPTSPLRKYGQKESQSPSQQQQFDPSKGIHQLQEQDQFQDIIKHQKIEAEKQEMNAIIQKLEEQLQNSSIELQKKDENIGQTINAFQSQIEELKMQLEEVQGDKDAAQSENDYVKKAIEDLRQREAETQQKRQKDRTELNEEAKRMLNFQLENQREIWIKCNSLVENPKSKEILEQLANLNEQICQLDLQKSMNNLALNSLEIHTSDSRLHSLDHALNTQILSLKHTLFLLDESKTPLVSRKLQLLKEIEILSSQNANNYLSLSSLQEDLADAKENLARITKEMSLKQISAKSVQNAYNELLQEYGRILNQSITTNQKPSIRTQQSVSITPPLILNKSSQSALSGSLSPSKQQPSIQPELPSQESQAFAFIKKPADAFSTKPRYESSCASANDFSNNPTFRTSKEAFPQDS